MVAENLPSTRTFLPWNTSNLDIVYYGWSATTGGPIYLLEQQPRFIDPGICEYFGKDGLRPICKKRSKGCKSTSITFWDIRRTVRVELPTITHSHYRMFLEHSGSKLKEDVFWSLLFLRQLRTNPAHLIRIPHLQSALLYVEFQSYRFRNLLGNSALTGPLSTRFTWSMMLTRSFRNKI